MYLFLKINKELELELELDAASRYANQDSALGHLSLADQSEHLMIAAISSEVESFITVS